MINRTSSAAGKVMTFYSFKGGVGRTMALANVARLLARRVAETGGKVLAIDWDLEAPGLHHYLSAGRATRAPGLIEFFEAVRALAPKTRGRKSPPPALPPYRRFVVSTSEPGLDLMKAGRFDSAYSSRVGAFDWRDLFNRWPESFVDLRESLVQDYTHVLIDSRTGVADTAGICTVLLPDKLVTLFTPNEQNRRGLKAMIPRAIEQRRKSPDERPLIVFPVPSRIDLNEFRNLSGWLSDFQSDLEFIFRRRYALPRGCSLTEHFDRVTLPYVSYYSYGEPNVVGLEAPANPFSLKAAYERLTERLLLPVPWNQS